jgi:vacuolar-type H+-ATPase subunit E/Vma4
MSNLEQLRQTLAEEAAAQAAEVLAEAERRATAIRSEAETKAGRLRAEAVGAAERENEARDRQAEAEARLHRRQALLSAKAGLVGQVMAEARQKLAGLPEAEYRAFLAGLIAASAPRGRVTVTFGARDHDRLGQAFLDQMAADLATAGRSVQLILADRPGDFAAGVRLAGAEFEVDCAVHRLLERAAELVEPEVAKALFD